MTLSTACVPDSIISQQYCIEYCKQDVALKIMRTTHKKGLLIARCKANVYQYLIFNNINIFCEYIKLLHEREKTFYMVYKYV